MDKRWMNGVLYEVEKQSRGSFFVAFADGYPIGWYDTRLDAWARCRSCASRHI